MISSLIEFLANLVISSIEALGYFGVFLAMAIESACIPLPSEVIMPFSGYLVYQGQMNLLLVGVIGALGNLAGSLLAYWLGAWGGRPFLEKYGKYVLLSHHDLDVADRWFAKYGRSTVFFTRMMPVVRTFISFPAGMSRMKLSTFCTFTFLGALPWSLALAYLGYVIGASWRDTLSGYFHKADIFIAVILVAAVGWYVYRHIKNLQKDKEAHRQADGGQVQESSAGAGEASASAGARSIRIGGVPDPAPTEEES